MSPQKSDYHKGEAIEEQSGRSGTCACQEPGLVKNLVLGPMSAAKTASLRADARNQRFLPGAKQSTKRQISLSSRHPA